MAAPLPRPANSLAIGPGPLRTARGARRLVFERRDRDGRRAWLPDDRVRDFEPEPDPVVRDVLFVRDPGGEDVRVAMVRA